MKGHTHLLKIVGSTAPQELAAFAHMSGSVPYSFINMSAQSMWKNHPPFGDKAWKINLRHASRTAMAGAPLKAQSLVSSVEFLPRLPSYEAFCS
jgi:hypothetical protein